MSRKNSYKKTATTVDPKFKSPRVGLFVNRMTLKGKKSLAERLVYDAFDIIATKITDKEPLDVFLTAVKNAMPLVKVKAKRIGGATYQVPVEVEPRVSEAFGHRWIIESARSRGGRTFSEKLANELLDAYDRKGRAVETKEATHRMAEANKAFAHYR